MQDPQTLKVAKVVETREKSYWVEAECLVNGREQKTLRFWVAKSQTMVDGTHVTIAKWILEKKEEEIAEWENKRLDEGRRKGEVFRTVEILVYNADPEPAPRNPDPGPETEDDLPF